jgi:hypothetical protein
VTRAAEPQPVALFRGEIRAATLAVLASARNPLTGYRIAQIARKQRIKVNSELKTLLDIGLVSRAAATTGNPGWVLTDPDLRRYFQRTMRISWSEDWFTGRAARQKRNLAFLRKLARNPVDLTKFSGYKPPFPEEFAGRAETDKELAALGLRQSGRHSS